MNNVNDFVIENGVLKKYVGPGGDVIVPGKAKIIGTGAFSNRSDVTGIVLSEGTKSVQKYAFDGVGATSITIPYSMKDVEGFAFAKCDKLTRIQVPDDHAFYLSVDGILFDKAKKNLVCCPAGIQGSYIVPDGVEKIEVSAFSYCVDLTGIIIPQSIKSIKECSFAGCIRLKEVLFKVGIESIGSRAFIDCTELGHLALPNTIKDIGAEAFRNCVGLKHVTIPGSVLTIGFRAFEECSGLKEITLPESIQSMDDGIFQGCSCVVRIHEWKKIYNTGFKGCNDILICSDGSISEIPANFRPQALCGFISKGEISEDSERAKSYLAYTRKNVAKLIQKAFDDPALLIFLCNYQLISPKVVDAYLQEAQNRSMSEQKVFLLQYLNDLGTEKVSAVKEKMEKKQEEYENGFVDRLSKRAPSKNLEGMIFANDGGFSSVWMNSKKEVQAYLEIYGAKLNESVTKKTDYLVAWNLNSNTNKVLKAKEYGVRIITEADFNDMIGKRFKDAQHIEVPCWMRSIPNRAFCECKNMKSLVIPEGVTSICTAAFQSCSSLRIITIPESVVEIMCYPLGEHAFIGCPDVTIHAPAGSYAEKYAEENGIPFVSE